jgi:hypothetical protein
MDKLVNNSDYISDEVLNSNHKKSLEKTVKLFREKKRLKHEPLERRYLNLLIEAIDNAFIQCELEVTQCELTLGLWETLLSSNVDTRMGQIANLLFFK